jgi:valyl-tRNA synthetase
MCIYKLIWDDFCSSFLEIIKPAYKQPIDKKTYNSVINIIENNLRILHPFMPFISEEIWQSISLRKKENALIVSKWPRKYSFDSSIISDFEFANQVISGVRSIRKEKNISFKVSIDLYVLNNESFDNKFDSLIIKLCNINNLIYTKNEITNSLSFRVKSNNYYIPVDGNVVDVKDEIIKLQTELEYVEGFLLSVQKKLSNSRFVDNAPEKVIQVERNKQSDAMAKIKAIKDSLNSLQ